MEDEKGSPEKDEGATVISPEEDENGASSSEEEGLSRGWYIVLYSILLTDFSVFL